MDMFQLAVLMANSSFSNCSAMWYTVLRLLGMNQTSCSYDSSTASWKPTEEKVDIIVDTKLHIIQQCSVMTDKANSMLNYIMSAMASRPFIPLYSRYVFIITEYWAPQLKRWRVTKTVSSCPPREVEGAGLWRSQGKGAI